MKMKFTVNKKDFVAALNAVTLKGKYKSAHTSKLGNISNDVAGAISDDGNTLTLSNASDTLAAMCKTNINNYESSGLEEEKKFMFFFEVERALKYLKTFKYEDMYVTITQSNLILKTERQRAQIPLLVQHSGIGAISKISTMQIDHTSEEFPTFGRTLFESRIVLEGDELSEAIKNCSIVGNATYKLNFNKDALTLASVNFHQTENYKVTVPIISGEGEEATLEFSAPLDKFCSGTMFLYLKDDSPILLCGVDRKLLVAPYIRGWLI